VTTRPTTDRLQGAPLALEAVGLTKHYGAVAALDNVSLRVRAGEVVAVCGENGAGKSTLMKVISGLIEPDSGSLRICEQNAPPEPPARRAERGIALVPQELTLCPDLTVAENVSLGKLPTRGPFISWRTVRAEARARLQSLGLADLDVKAQVGGLSVAEMAFVQIARALQPDSMVLIVDEPTAPLSARESQALLTLLRQVAARGVAILFVTHRLDEVLEVCDRAVVLRDGRLVAEIDGADLTRNALVAAMVGDADLSVPEAPARSGEPLLQATGLTGGTIADVSLHVCAGEIVGVYGLLGSGRDELGGLLVGATARDDGEVSVGGTPLPRGNVRAAIKAGVGYVPAERRASGLALDQSIKDNLTLGVVEQLARRGWRDRAAERQAAQEWVTTLDIAAPSVDAPVASLSGGGQQKVLIARWLAAGSRCLVLDEPTRGVDVATKASIYRLLAEQAGTGTAVLVISSDLEEVMTVATRVLVIRDGRIIADVADPQQSQVAALALGSTQERHAS
jgi:ABC-type sugar transport system ATPase subunit